MNYISQEKSIPIKIQENIKNEKKYSVKQSIFDPTKCSPPNEFMIKLYIRSKKYE
jgi:hypothetical protein